MDVYALIGVFMPLDSPVSVQVDRRLIMITTNMVLVCWAPTTGFFFQLPVNFNFPAVWPPTALVQGSTPNLNRRTIVVPNCSIIIESIKVRTNIHHASYTSHEEAENKQRLHVLILRPCERMEVKFKTVRLLCGAPTLFL